MEHVRPNRKDPKAMERFVADLELGAKIWRAEAKDPRLSPAMQLRAKRLAAELAAEAKRFRK